MIHTIVCCDYCGKELPVKTIITPFGTAEVVEVDRTKVWNTATLFSHLCKECALTIDNALLTTKLELLERG